MNTRHETARLSALAIAVAGALNSMPALADEEEIKALKLPTNTVEVGVANNSDKSAKFGEYNGLNKSGATFIGNLNFRGGDAYGDSGGTTRWSITGIDLGLTSRSIGASIGDQGRWLIGIGYDELRHNLTDTYQTPYLGTMGGNSFTLPPGFGVNANANALTAAQQAAFRNLDVSSTRKNTSLSAALILSPQWELKFDFNHLDQSGAKLMGFGSMQRPVTGGTVTAEYVSILPNPTQYKTDTLNMAANWTGEQAHLSATYFGSFFRDGVDRVTFQTWAGANDTQTMSTPPSNSFHQLGLSGGYRFSPATRFAGSLSYGRNTQDRSFVTDPFMMVAQSPVGSLNGLVVTTHADAKLTHQSIKNLTLSAGFRYDERDNRTASNAYNFLAIDGAHPALYPNTPLSNRKTQFELAGDYRLGKASNLRMSLAHEGIDRWCNNYAVTTGYPAGTNCVVAHSSKEDKAEASYRVKASDTVDVRLGLGYADRKTDTDVNAIAAFISVNGGLPGQNAGDFRGFSPYFAASRTQQLARANVNWQVSDQFSLGLGGRFTGDDYGARFGVQKGNSWSVNLDATYTFGETGSVYSYLSRQHRQRDLTDQQNGALVTANATRISVPANSDWTNTLKDNDLTFGLGAKYGGLMSGKLEVSGDVTRSIGKSVYSTALNYAGATTGGLTCADPSLLSCGQLPDIRNKLTQVKLTGAYRLDKRSTVSLRYLYQRLNSSDYFYNGYQFGFTPNQVLPTNQQSGSYSVNVVFLSYIHTF